SDFDLQPTTSASTSQMGFMRPASYARYDDLEQLQIVARLDERMGELRRHRDAIGAREPIDAIAVDESDLAGEHERHRDIAIVAARLARHAPHDADRRETRGRRGDAEVSRARDPARLARDVAHEPLAAVDAIAHLARRQRELVIRVGVVARRAADLDHLEAG